MFNSKSERWIFVCSSVAASAAFVEASAAFVEACFRTAAALTEAGEPALWKRVTMSRVLRYSPSSQ